MLKLLAPGSNTIASTSVVSAENVRFVILEVAKVATSVGPLGTAGGVQFAALFQLPFVGFVLHVALSAWTPFSAASKSVRMVAQDRIGDFMAPIMPMALFESKADST